MMAVLEFDCTPGPDCEEERFLLAAQSADFYLAVLEFDNYLRSLDKADAEPMTHLAVRQELGRCLERHGVSLEMLS